MYVAQQCFVLSDEGIEDAIYDGQAIRRFVGIDLARETAPDLTALVMFRRLLERHGLTQKVFETINAHLAANGLLMREGTIVDGPSAARTIIAASPATKNRDKERDPEMHQTKKGNQWFFGMKSHIGVDADSGLVHTVVGTAANVGDVIQAGNHLHGQETEAFGDGGYQGVVKRRENRGGTVTWKVAMKRGQRRALPETERGPLLERVEKIKASIRSKVEHPFHVLKNLLGHRKTRYRGLAKNTAQLMTLFGLANQVLARRRLMALDTQVAP